MRPITLSIEGFRSFGTEHRTTIEFEDRDLIAIIGDTGAGKSSILEAMTYALYGQTSFAGNANREIVNDECRHCEVSLVFWASSYQWEATRRLERRKNGEVGSATAVLIQRGDGDEALETVEGVHEVNRRTAELLGLDAAAFLRTMVLPQGRFARLLAEDEPRNRSRILRQIWRTDEIDAAAGVLKAAGERARSLRERLDADLDHLPEDPEKRLEELRREATEAGRASEAAQRTADHVLKHAAERQTLEAEQTALVELERTASAERPDAEAAQALGEASRRLETDEEAARERLAAARNALERTEAPPDGAAERLDRRLAAIEGAREQAATAARDEERREQAEAGRKSAAEAAAAARRELEAADGTWKQAQEEADAARSAAKAAGDTAAAARQETAEHQRRYTDGIARLRERREAVAAEAASATEDARRAADDQRARAAVAAERRREAERAMAADRAAAAAHGHRAGEPCPVCERELPAGWTPPGGADIEEAQRRAAEAEDDAAEARQNAERRQAAAAQGTREAVRLAKEVSDLEAEEERAAVRLNDAYGLPPWATAEDRAAKAAEIESRSGAAEQEAAAAIQRETKTAQQRTEAEVAARGTKAILKHEEQRTETANRSAATSRTGLESALQRLNAELDAEEQTDAAALLNGTDDAARAAAKLAELGDTTRREAAGLRQQAEIHGTRAQAAVAAAGEVDRLREQRKTEVDGPLTRAVEAAEQARERVAEAAAAGGLTTKLPKVGAGKDGSENAAAIGRLAAAFDLTAHEARTRRERNRQREREAIEALDAACEAAGIPAGERNAETAANTVRAEAAEAAGRYHRARDEVARLESIRKPIDELAKLRTRVGEHEGRLAEVADALRAGRFPKWLTLRRSTDLLRHASRALEEMSGGRYAFADPRETAEEWKVIDRWTGADRSPASLSGGEQFVASLALSLGMVETMGERGGRLECMFLDEGFGTLDRQALDEAVEALHAGARPDHMIGVITHVREVAERMPAVLRVEREPGRGSTARWLTDRERNELLGDEGDATLSTKAS